MESIRNDASSDAVAELWAMFRKHLAARTREINEEVAHYPRPIARCDVQLSKLLEEHDDPWLRDLLAKLGPGDLPAVQALSAAVLKRSYSRSSGRTSWEVQTNQPGSASATTRAAARSWAGLT